MAYDFKKLSDVTLQESVSESTNVYIEENGETKRIPANQIGGNGVSSWNDLTDKPFEDTRKTEEVVIEWDGNTEGKYFVDPMSNGNMVMCKVSDITPTVEELNGSNGLVLVDGEENTFPLSADTIDTSMEGMVAFPPLGFVVYTAPFNQDGVTIEETGIYFYSVQDAGIRGIKLSYTTQTGELKQIDPKYIEDMYYEESAKAIVAEGTFETGGSEWSSVCGYIEGTLEVGKEYTVVVNGVEYKCTCETALHDSEGYQCPSLNAVGGYNPMANWSDRYGAEGDMPFGMWKFPHTNSINVILSNTLLTFPATVQIIADTVEVHKIDPKYMPEHSHSWNDLEDKPFDCTLVEKEFVYNTDSSGTIIGYTGIPFVEGQAYRVYNTNWSSGTESDFKQYYPDRVEYPQKDSKGELYIGTIGATGDTWYFSESTAKLNPTWDYQAKVGRVKVVGLFEEVQKIDTKYLPDTTFVVDASNSSSNDVEYGNKVKDALLSGANVMLYAGGMYFFSVGFEIIENTTGGHSTLRVWFSGYTTTTGVSFNPAIAGKEFAITL